jgi:hypothetical protein
MKIIKDDGKDIQIKVKQDDKRKILLKTNDFDIWLKLDDFNHGNFSISWEIPELKKVIEKEGADSNEK